MYHTTCSVYGSTVVLVTHFLYNTVRDRYGRQYKGFSDIHVKTTRALHFRPRWCFVCVHQYIYSYTRVFNLSLIHI